MTRFLQAAGVLLLGALLVVGASCGDSKQGQNKDVGVKDVPQTFDSPNNDITVDGFNGGESSPDLNSDLWPNEGGYSGAPFGCFTDSDCFGQKCCPTPWGVRLCSATCAP